MQELIEIDRIRTNFPVDPHLHVWGPEVALYLFLGGMTAGVMILTALAPRRTPDEAGKISWMGALPLTAPLLLSAGMLMLFLDLEHPLHVWRFYTALVPTSPMSWGSWILLAIYPATLLLGLATVDPRLLARFPGASLLARLASTARLDALQGWARAHETGLRQANLLLGLALGTYTGILLGTLGARALWSSSVLGPLFLASGLSAGAAFLMLFPLDDQERHFLRRWDMVALAVELALLGLYLTGLATGDESARQALALFLGGSYTALFWALVVLAGLLLPLLLEALEARLRLTAAVLAPALVLLGSLSLRMLLVSAGQ